MSLRQYLKWLWRQTPGHRGLSLLTALVGVVNVGLTLSMVWITKTLIDAASGKYFLSNPSLDMRWLIGFFCGIILLRPILGWISSYTENLNEVKMRTRMQASLYTQVMNADWLCLNIFHSGDVIGRLREDVADISQLVCRIVPQIFVTATRLGGALVFISIMQPWLALCVVGIMPIALVLSKAFMRRMRRLNERMRLADSTTQSRMLDGLRHRPLYLTMQHTGRAIEESEGDLSTVVDITRERTVLSARSRTWIGWGFGAGYGVAFLWGIAGLHNGTLTYGMMAAFLQLVAMIQGPTVDLSRILPTLLRSITSADRICALELLPTEPIGKDVWLDAPAGIRMENVDFRYSGELDDVLYRYYNDFTPGQMHFVKGPSGKGKTTLLRLITALVYPTNGKITFYDNHGHEYQASADTRCNIAYVPQGNSLVRGTIRENLLMGRPNATDQDMAEALRQAQADFVFELPDGLDTACGESNTGLSEGQAQRIAIARALLRPGSVLLLDEPTSALDHPTAVALIKTLQAIPNRTIIIITHQEY